MKRRKESGAHYRNQKKQREELLKSYPKITAFQAGGGANQERPAFLSAAAARLYCRKFPIQSSFLCFAFYLYR
jgi:hypothetical protein